ncbi:MAG: 23S rRNA (uracil(1939)-C(5))-methyltransferase RlmD [Clostridia bacterium]
MNIGDNLIVEVVSLGMDGEGVAKVNGMVVFIPMAVIGDLAKIKIVHIKKNLAFAELIKVMRASELRVTPKCEYFGICGGCDLQHINAVEQSDFKREQVQNCLHKVGLNNVECAPVVCGEKFFYRNKLQLPIGEIDGKIVAGFYKKSSHEIVEINDCLLHGNWAKKIIKVLLEWANGKYGTSKLSAYSDITGKGLLRHLVVRFVDNFLCITLVINGDNLPNSEALISALKQLFDFNLYISINKRNTNVIFGDTIRLIYGQEKTLNIAGVNLPLSPLSFLQVNDEIRDKIYAETLLKLEGIDVVFDVYSGVGILSAMLANHIKSSYYPCVYGIEIVEDATRNANSLMQLNNLTKSVKNICGDAAAQLPLLTKNILEMYNCINKGEINNKNNIICDNLNKNKLDNLSIQNDILLSANSNNYVHKIPNIAVVLDPPRKGCDEAVLNAIIQSNSAISKIIYISCNPATLARDLTILAKSYDVEVVIPFDMFPQTKHVECMVLMSRK